MQVWDLLHQTGLRIYASKDAISTPTYAFSTCFSEGEKTKCLFGKKKWYSKKVF